MTDNDMISTLIRELSGGKVQSEIAMNKLIAIGQPAIAPLLAILETQNGREAVFAARILGEIGDESVIAALTNALAASSPLLSGVAIDALLKLSPPDLALRLVGAFAQARPITQQSLLIPLQELGDVCAVPMLIEQLPRVLSPVVKCAIIKTLGLLGDATTIPVIQAYAHDEDPHVREWVQRSLERLGKGNAVCG